MEKNVPPGGQNAAAGVIGPEDKNKLVVPGANKQALSPSTKQGEDAPRIIRATILTREHRPSPPIFGDLHISNTSVHDATPEGSETEATTLEASLSLTSVNSTATHANRDSAPEDEILKSEGRGMWDNQLQFLLSCVSLSVGLGNVWRFPFVAFDNGGGAFLIPYVIILMLVGLPLYFLELCLGQFTSYGPVKIWNMAPIFKGVGYGSILGTICNLSYYCSILAQTVHYFFICFEDPLPWLICDKLWYYENVKVCINDTHPNPNSSFTKVKLDDNEIDKTISQLYYEIEAFPLKHDINDGLGRPNAQLTLCLFVTWVLIFFSVMRGVKSSGKVAYFTATFPYVILIVLFIRGCTLEGAGSGLIYFIQPDWSKLADPKVWYAAVAQCFFSLAIGFGSIVVFASYNPLRHNIYRDVWIICIIDTVTSIICGCTIFSVLGFLAHKRGLKDIRSVANAGPELAFISYPEAIKQFKVVPQLFAVLFFMMMFTLGIGSADSMAFGLMTVICDQFPKWRPWLVTLVICFFGFLSGLMYITPGGQFMIELIDFFGSNILIYVMAMIEVFAVSWIYGVDNFCKDIEFMLGMEVGWYWKICWRYIIPLGLLVILIYSIATMNELDHDGLSFPVSAIACGWLLAVTGVLFVPGFALYTILSKKTGSFIEKVKASKKPTDDWGPQDPKVRWTWQDFKRRY